MLTPEELKGFLPYLEPELLAAWAQEAKYLALPPGQALLREGGHVPSLPWVLEGRIRVVTSGDDKELLLYYIEPRQSCVMSFSACLTQQPSQVSAWTETDTKLLLLPAEKLSGWLLGYPSFQRSMNEQYQLRYLDLLDTVDQLVFHRLEDRLMAYLDKRMQGRERLQVTHQEIARDLGTAREVVSRGLKKLEAEGKVQLGRNEVLRRLQ